MSYQILGLPNESLDSMIQTLAFNARLPVLLGASPFYRTPVSPIARGLDLTEEDYVKARLTAMAVETDEFRREDIYTLFITTRIINFLKGLRLSASTDVNALLNCSWSDDRTRIGFELLRLLRETNRLYFWTTKGLRQNEKFEAEVFFRVLKQAGVIGCQNGQRIIVGEFSGSGVVGTTESANDSCSYRLTARSASFRPRTFERLERLERLEPQPATDVPCQWKTSAPSHAANRRGTILESPKT